MGILELLFNPTIHTQQSLRIQSNIKVIHDTHMANCTIAFLTILQGSRLFVNHTVSTLIVAYPIGYRRVFFLDFFQDSYYTVHFENLGVCIMILINLFLILTIRCGYSPEIQWFFDVVQIGYII